MKNLLSKIKWLLKHTKPFILSLVLLMILGSITSISGIYKALILKRLIDAATHTEMAKMIGALFILSLFFIMDITIQVVTSKLSVKCYTKMNNSIQENFYKKIMFLKWTAFNNYHSGDILTRLTSDADAVTNLLTTIIPNMVSNIILFLGSFVMLLYFDSTLALLALIFSPIPILMSKFFSVKIKRLYKKLQEKESQYRSFMNESIQNIAIVKSFCLEMNNIKRIKTMQDEKLDLTLSRNNLTIIYNTIFTFSSLFIFLLVYSWGSMKLSKGAITFGTITAMMQLIGNIKEPLSFIATSITKVISTIASAERLIEIETLESDYNDAAENYMNYAGIEFNNVNFSYNDSKPILKDINLKINPRETVALIGSSGEGKTTLIKTILSLIYPNTGNIFITNNNERFNVSAANRKMISYVPQGNTLFSGTIYDNVKLGNITATDDEIKDALCAACTYDFINTLPDGLNTIIGEGGLGLSEGQAQRIAIARALVKKSPILLLDEATSALDSSTEVKVLESIKHLRPTPTCIIITHRPTALNICEKIFKLDHGNIIELQNNYSSDVAAELLSG